jgi:hypothetical protein
MDKRLILVLVACVLDHLDLKIHRNKSIIKLFNNISFSNRNNTFSKKLAVIFKTTGCRK